MRLFLLLSTLLTMALPATGSHELGPRLDPNEMSAGGLLLETPSGLREAPTLDTEVEISVTGMIARTRVTQRFTNPTRDWVEGVYVFPLPEKSAVDSLSMRVGDRVIEGHVEERAQAKATYRKAKTEGRKTSLVEQERPNLFTTSIANLGPGEQVEVTLTYQEDLWYDGGRFSLRFPMVVAPRFNPGATRTDGFSGTGWAHNTDEVPDASRITPPTADPASDRAHPVTIRVEIDAGFELEDVESSSHPILVRAAATHVYRVVLDGGPVPADADFVLGWSPVVGAAPSAALFRQNSEGEEYALLMIVPPRSEMAVNTRVSRETIIVIDTSGSMGGESIIQARSAVDHALGTLHPEDAFNVIRFDSNHIPLFESTRPATADAIATARQWVSQLRADGGTNMMPALESALTPGRESRAVRQVIFVTDGAVGNESALFQTIQSRLGLSRLYTVGIGSAPNSHFMSKAAQIGRGTFTYVSRPSEVAEKMGELFDKLESPVLHDLSIDWVARSGGGITNVEAWPAQIPDVYLGEPIVIAARVPMDISHVVLHGRRGNQDVRLEIPFEGGSKHQGVANLWARRKVAALMDSLHEGASIDRVSVEVAALGVRHQLVTRWSSLVAVDVTPTAPVDVVPDTRVVPSLLPRGWDFFKIFGGSAPEASVQEQQRAARPPHTADASPSDSAADSVIRPVAINQQVASVQIGRLPQGATPAALLLSIGSVLLGGASIAWRAAGRGEQLIATSDTSEQAKPSETA